MNVHETSLVFLVVQFLICLLLIFLSGRKLSLYADIIAEKFHLTRGWIGLLILAPVTSLPEFFNGLSAVLWVKAPNIAAGDILGSCVCNLFFLALLDIISGKRPLVERLTSSFSITSGFSIMMLTVVGLGILTSPPHWFISPYSLVLGLLYLTGMHLIYKKEGAQLVEQPPIYSETHMSEAVKKFLFNALIIVLAATWLPRVGRRLAEVSGLTQTFIGSSLIAFTTSVPELVVTLAAFKLGSSDMAVANILGSNNVNLFLLAIYDMLYLKGCVLGMVSHEQLINIFSAILMTSLFELDIKVKFSHGYFKVSSIVLTTAYFLNLFLLYKLHF